jgi:hypothetical protein
LHKLYDFIQIHTPKHTHTLQRSMDIQTPVAPYDIDQLVNVLSLA